MMSFFTARKNIMSATDPNLQTSKALKRAEAKITSAKALVEVARKNFDAAEQNAATGKGNLTGRQIASYNQALSSLKAAYIEYARIERKETQEVENCLMEIIRDNIPAAKFNEILAAIHRGNAASALGLLHKQLGDLFKLPRPAPAQSNNRAVSNESNHATT
jgi:hypothetical protein